MRRSAKGFDQETGVGGWSHWSSKRGLRGSALLISSVVLALAVSVSSSANSGAEGARDAGSKVADTVECPFLTRTRYPFLQCRKNALGQVEFDAKPVVLEELRIPDMDSFIDGPGHWGR